MNTSFIEKMTPEQRAEALVKAKEARAEKSRIWKENAHKLRQSFADSNHWRKLASKYGVRMPNEFAPSDEYKPIRRAMRKLGIEPQQVKDAFGGDVKHIHRMNPTWPAYAVIGLLLEMREEMDGAE